MRNKEENVKRSCFVKQYECLIISYRQDFGNLLFQSDHDLIIIQRFIQIPYWLVRDIWRFEEVCIKIITFQACQGYSHWISVALYPEENFSPWHAVDFVIIFSDFVCWHWLLYPYVIYENKTEKFLQQYFWWILSREFAYLFVILIFMLVLQ